MAQRSVRNFYNLDLEDEEYIAWQEAIQAGETRASWAGWWKSLGKAGREALITTWEDDFLATVPKITRAEFQVLANPSMQK